MIGVLLTGCMQFELPAGNFEEPSAVTVLQPEVGGPFEEPVGFVANGIGGQIVMLSLKQGRLLTDDRTAPFLPANQLATGDRRLLSSVAVYAPTRTDVTVFVGDVAFGQLLVVPYLEACDDDARGFCEGTEAIVEAPDGVRAFGKFGWTTTETWMLHASGGEWIAEGSRSGLQPDPIRRDELPWSALDRRLEITAVPRPVDGETLTIETRSGLTEIDVDGVPLALELAPDQSVLAMVVQDPQTLQSRVRWLDPAEPRTVLGEVDLPDGARPHRISVSEEGGLLVADASRSAFYEVDYGATDAVEHVMPWPTLDVAGLRLESGNPDSDVRFVVPIDGGSLWRYDPVSAQLLDANPAVVGAQGLVMDPTVQGIEAIPFPYRAPELDEGQERVVTRSVAVSLTDGRVVFAHEDTGCLVQDPRGPQTNLAQRAGTLSTDITTSGIPATVDFLSRFAVPIDGLSNRVEVNGCGGIARPETWAVRFDQNLGTWEVEGSLSGVQDNRVVEDQRYVSDDGAVSFLLRSGASPSLDGWGFSFTVGQGIAVATGDADNNNARETDLSVPGDPAFFFYKVTEVGPVTLEDLEERPRRQRDLSFNPNIRPFVLVPGGATNLVGRVDPSDDRAPVVEVEWE